MLCIGLFHENGKGFSLYFIIVFNISRLDEINIF